MDIGSSGDTSTEFKPSASLIAWTSRPIYPQCMRQKYVDAWRWSCPKIVQEPGKELKDMNSEKYEFYRKELVVSLGPKFNNRDSPWDKTLHVKGGYLLPLIEE